MAKTSSILNATNSDAYLNAVRNGTLQQGIGIDCDLDKHLLFKHGSFNLIMGQSNVGKTDWVLWYLACLTMKHKLSWLIFSSENNIGSLKRKILQFMCGEELTKLNDEDFNRLNQKMNNYFKFIDTDVLYSAKDLLTIFDENKEMFDGAIIDPYNSLKRPNGVNAHDYDYEIASEFRLFCKRTKKTIYIIAHAVTESLRKVHSKDHRYGGFPMPPNEADIEGGGKWANRADDFIVLHRYKAHESEWMSTHIHVKKVKETETGGKPTFLDEPVVCFKYYNSFQINHKDPIKDMVVTDKPLPRNINFYETEKDEVEFTGDINTKLPF